MRQSTPVQSILLRVQTSIAVAYWYMPLNGVPIGHKEAELYLVLFYML